MEGARFCILQGWFCIMFFTLFHPKWKEVDVFTTRVILHYVFYTFPTKMEGTNFCMYTYILQPIFYTFPTKIEGTRFCMYTYIVQPIFYTLPTKIEGPRFYIHRYILQPIFYTFPTKMEGGILIFPLLYSFITLIF